MMLSKQQSKVDVAPTDELAGAKVSSATITTDKTTVNSLIYDTSNPKT